MMTKVKRFTYLPIFLLVYYIIGSSTALDNEQQQLLLRTTPPAATMFMDQPNSSSLTQRNLQTTPPAATIDDNTHPVTDRDLRFKNKFFWAAGKSGKSGAGGGLGHQLPRCHGSCKSHDDCMVSCL